jgi:hypothetical protein
MQAIADAASTALQWLDQGYSLEKVPEETRKFRIAICEGCPDFLNPDRRCARCCCPMDFKTTLKYVPFSGIVKKKPITCPVGKW